MSANSSLLDVNKFSALLFLSTNDNPQHRISVLYAASTMSTLLSKALQLGFQKAF